MRSFFGGLLPLLTADVWRCKSERKKRRSRMGSHKNYTWIQCFGKTKTQYNSFFNVSQVFALLTFSTKFYSRLNRKKSRLKVCWTITFLFWRQHYGSLWNANIRAFNLTKAYLSRSRCFGVSKVTLSPCTSAEIESHRGSSILCTSQHVIKSVTGPCGTIRTQYVFNLFILYII